MDLRNAIKNRTLWIGFLAVLVPLGILLALQYRWLVKLEQTSAVAHQATLDNYLDTIVAEVEWMYKKAGGRTLEIPAYYFTENKVDKAAVHFKKWPFQGASRTFVIDYTDPEDSKKPQFFRAESGCFETLPFSAEVRAVYVAAAPWRVMAEKKTPVDGASLTFEQREPGYPVLLNPIISEDSKVVGLAGMILDPDVFARKLLPKAVAGALPKFSGSAEDEEPVVTVWDDQGLVAWANDEAGWSPDEPIDGGAGERVGEAFSFVFDDWRISLTSRHKTPGQFARRNFALNIGLSAVLGLVLLGGIVLALRTASKEMKLSQMKSDFVSNVSHELRTPLASIRVFGEFFRLGRVGSSERASEYGEYIETESRRLTQLINNLLDFSSIESGRKQYRFETCDLEEIVRETVETFEVRLRQGNVRIAFHPPDETLPPIEIDPGAVAQALSNLIDNALKYSDGQPEIAVGIRRDERMAVIWVRDWGIGIPRDEQEKIFDRFHRVPTGGVHDIKGSGLGLAIVQHVSEAHRGRVTVASRPGRGSTFSFSVPIAVHSRPKRPEPDSAADLSELRLGDADANPSEA